MNSPARKWITRSLFAGAALAALATTAMADTYIVREHEYRDRPYESQYMGGPPAYAFDSREYDAHRHHCRAPSWNPNQRYMPGDTVRRNGDVYVARGISNRVYNENSPPEWTPNYWRQVEHC